MEKHMQAFTKKEMVTITKDEYEDLLSDARWLSCLESAGVDNWTGIHFAYEMMEEINGEQE